MEDALVDHHFKHKADDTIPVCRRCNGILAENSSLFQLWERWYPGQYPPLETQKEYVRYKNKQQELLVEWRKGRNRDGDKKREAVRKLWEPFYKTLCAEKSIFSEGDTRLLSHVDLENMHFSLALFDENGDPNSYPLPTCLYRYRYHLHPSSRRHLLFFECLIVTPCGRISTEGLSCDEIAHVIQKMKDSLRTHDYKEYERAVGVYRDICYLEDVLRQKRRRARNVPLSGVSIIEFLTCGVNSWDAKSTWSFPGDLFEF